MDAYTCYEMYRRIVDVRNCLLPDPDKGSSHIAVAGASQEVDDYTIVSPTLECMQLFIEVCANDLYSHLCNWMFISVIYIHTLMLFFCRQSKSHGLLAAIVCVIIGLHTHFWLWTYLPRITHILFIPLCCLITHNSSQWTVCCISHTPSSGCPFLLCLLIPNS